MKSFPLFVFLTLLFATASAIETIRFDTFLFGKKVGFVLVTLDTKPDGTELYIIETSSKAKFLWINRHNSNRYEVIYKSGKLISSVHKEMENEEVTRWTNVNWDGNQYLVDSYKGRRTFTEPPLYSVVSIYFKDISKVKRVFYEAEADFNELKKGDEPGTYEFKSSDGNRNVYHFLNGRIVSMEFHVSLAVVKMIRTN